MKQPIPNIQKPGVENAPNLNHPSHVCMTIHPPALSTRNSVRCMLLVFIGLCVWPVISACTTSSAATDAPATSYALSVLTPTTASFAPELSETPTPTPEAPSPTLTQTTTPTVTSTPTATPIPSPTPTPGPSLRQLTSGGCCVQPFFSPDSKQVLFIDKPTENAPVGIYGVDLTGPATTPVLVNDTIGFRSPDHSIVVTIEGDFLHFNDEENGQSWTVDTGGNWPHFSPDSSQILWVATDREGPYDRRQSDIWLANLDGSNANLLLSLYGGGFAGWFPDGERILLIGRENPNDEKRTLTIFDLGNGSLTNLLRHERIRGIEISPNDSWIVYFLSFSDKPWDNGLWVVNTKGTEQRHLDVPGFGAYRWRNDDTLLYIPIRTAADDSMQLWAVDASTGQSRLIIDSNTFSFSVANGDWDISPDGQYVVFVNSLDQNIWLITLPD